MAEYIEWFVLQSTCRWRCYDSFTFEAATTGQCPAGTHAELGTADTPVCALNP
jgi:hypothetical protein